MLQLHILQILIKGAKMTRVMKAMLLSMLLALGLHASDLLSKATGGSISDNTIGVKQLNTSEMKDVLGGYDFYRMPELDKRIGLVKSFAFVVTDDNGNVPMDLYKAFGGVLRPYTLLIGHLRYGKDIKTYSLHVYSADKSNTTYGGPKYSQILKEFQSKVNIGN